MDDFSGDGGASGSGVHEERPQRRVAKLLNAYYGIEGVERASPSGKGGAGSGASAGAAIDGQDFDAKQTFDSLVRSAQVADVVRRANELDAEVRDLDGDMQMIAYENYSKFIRATDVNKQIRSSVDTLDPCLKTIESNFSRITEHQHKVDDVISKRSGEIEAQLKQQRICGKLKILFDLPVTLQRCLDQGAYGRAVEAYCACAPFLRQHRDIKAFQTVLDDVELQMGRIRSSVEVRLQSSQLSVPEAVHSSVTLLDLGTSREKVAKDYISGRAAALRACLDRCFSMGEPTASAASREASGAAAPKPAAAAAEDPADQKDAPQGGALTASCALATKQYVPTLCDAVEGFQKLPESRDGSAAGEVMNTEDDLSRFVRVRVEDLFERISGAIELARPPSQELVSCIHTVRESLRRLHSLMPRVLTKLFTAFLGVTSSNAMKALFSDTAAGFVGDLVRLHGECRRLQEAKVANLDGMLDEASKIEQALVARSTASVADCQSLMDLVGSDHSEGQRLTRGFVEHLATLFSIFARVCCAYVGQASQSGVYLPGAAPAAALKLLEEVASLEWVGLFGLSLVWIGRRLEESAMNKTWAEARRVLRSAELAAPDFASSNPAVAKATQEATEAVITYYVLVGGQRLAHFFRNFVQARKWMAAKEPLEPSIVVEMVFQEAYSFDAQLGRILSDPRKPKGANPRRHYRNLNKTSMELELEHMMAKKVQVFAPVPFHRNGAVAGILRIAFKALCEYVREETFAKFGLQQIQVDIALCVELLRDIVETEEASTLSNILAEVVNSATNRCVEPTLMEVSVVEDLCDKKKRDLRFE